jgi:hypothetical protein
MATLIKKFDVGKMPKTSKSLILGFNSEYMHNLIDDLLIDKENVYYDLNIKEVNSEKGIIASVSPLYLDSRIKNISHSYIEYVDYLFLFQMPSEENTQIIYDKFNLNTKINSFSYDEFCNVLNICALQNKNECLVLKLNKGKLHYFWYATVAKQNYGISLPIKEEELDKSPFVAPKKISTWKWLKSWVV